MNWTEPTSPNKYIPYDHVLLKTPLGEISIEWKSWKERPSYDIMLDRGEWISAEYSLEDAKKSAINYLSNILQQLKDLLEKPEVCECWICSTDSRDTFSKCSNCGKTARF